ncbi:MAG: gamma-glutamyltransferase [Bradyrhizobiaceae bacterium]|nr:gamma-glutamyltransferase [Bradyrhizobiaceae bacterium]
MAHESIRSQRGVVAAPHLAAAEAGGEVLKEGGNAIEAAVAAASTIVAAYPHMNHIGGDGFWVLREPSGRVRYIEACGFAGARATRAFYREQGLERVPERGPLAALTVPGAVGGWVLALEAAKANGGRMPLARLLEPAIARARAGYPVSKSLAWRFTTERGASIEAPGFAETFLPGGKAPKLGEKLPAGKLADTFEHLARAGLDDFYRGDIGREIAADLERIGSPVVRADLERYRAVRRTPLVLPDRGGILYNSPPPTPGLVSLLILGIFERLGVREAESYEHVHAIVEATKRAFRIRDRVVTDFERLPRDPLDFLTPDALNGEAGAIDMQCAAPWPEPAGKGDTVWLGAADRSGLAVSYIQSLYFEFGSGCVLPKTGVVMQNRGCSFSLMPGALNALEPGRRPPHTLSPALAERGDGRTMAYGTMGGEGQPQTQAALFTRHVDFGVPLGEAIDRPRWILGRTWGSSVTNLRLEAGFRDEVAGRLRQAGHDVQVLAETHSEVMGHAGAVVLHRDGTLEAAHDPRSDGGAVAV